MSEKQLFEVFSPKSCEVVAVPTILKTAITCAELRDKNKVLITQYWVESFTTAISLTKIYVQAHTRVLHAKRAL